MADIAEMSPNNPGLDGVVLRARQWLKECLANHKHCKGVPASSEYPRRLIKIDKRKGHEWDLQLVPTQGEIVEYCALSYCWGLETDNFASTTNRNVESRYKGFSAEDLPRTLQDAIIICRLLDIPYLWIDALCIVQGDLQDWTIESSNMDQIYSGAAMTLIAAASLHANNGLLAPRWHSNGASWSLLHPQGLRVNPLRMISDAWLAVDNRTYANRQANVYTRAWTLQEELMSRRTLEWTRHGMIWSCPTVLRREWTEDDHATSDVSVCSQPDFVSRRYAAFVHRSTDQATMRIAWTEALMLYLRRNITRSEDRLAAFAGLTRIATTLTKGRVAGGLWLDKIAEDLLWGRTHMSYQTAMEREASWSWTTLPGECQADAWIGYEASSMSSTACILEDILLDPTDGGISTPLRSGRLRIRSKKRQFPSKGEREWVPARAPGFSYHSGHIALNLDLSCNQDDNFWNKLACFKVLEICGREFGLLICPMNGSSVCDQYRRVGRFEILPSADTTALIHSPGLKGMERVDWLRDAFKPSNAFFQGCGEYVVNIV